jgi:hypothetical protein
MRVRSIVGMGLLLAGSALLFAAEAVGGTLLEDMGLADMGLAAGDSHAGAVEASLLPSPAAGLPLLGVAALIALRTRRDSRGR